MAHRLVRGLRGAVKNLLQQQQRRPSHGFLKSSTRNYVSEMRKSAFEGNILRLIRDEIQYELDHSPAFEVIAGNYLENRKLHEVRGQTFHSSERRLNGNLSQTCSLISSHITVSHSKPVPEFNSFKIDERPGEQWIRLNRKFGENEDIKIEVTMFDGSLPIKKTDDTDDVKLHITLIIDVFKGEDNDILEFVCSAWPDSIEIRKVFTRGHGQLKDQPYMGPEFKELDDELQDSLYDFLEERDIDDDLAEFLHQYMRSKDKNEYLRWMENLKSFIQRK